MLWILALTACRPATAPGPPPPTAGLVRLAVEHYPHFQDDTHFDGLAAGLSQSIAYYRRLPEGRTFRFGTDRYGARHLQRTCQQLITFLQSDPSGVDLNRFMRERFRVYRAAGRPSNGQVLFTGYYEPVLHGSRQRTERYRFPVYARPDDLITIDLAAFDPQLDGRRIVGRLQDRKVVPYPDRRAIENDGRIDGRARVLAWVDSRVDLFFLQIQGSGRIQLASGGSLGVYYDGANGRPYRSIGKLLIEQGRVPAAKMSMQAIRAYLRQHPEQVDEILNHNPSYVFFRIGSGGPYGSLGVAVTPGRSIATDRRIFPPGAPAFMETRIPLLDGSGQVDQWTPTHRLVINQDTGGAIRGPGRADLFWGLGPYAEMAAGHMRHEGRLYFLVLNPDGQQP